LPGEIYGETKYKDIDLTYYSNRWGLDLYFMHYEGFHIDNTSDFINGSDEKIQQSNMELLGIGGDVFFSIIGDNFSLKSAFKSTGKQLKNAGALMLMFSLNHIRVTNDRPIIPPSEMEYYGSGAAFRDALYYSVNFMPGAGYTFVLWKFYFTPVIFAGPGYQFQHYETVKKDAEENSIEGDEIDVNLIVMKYNFRLAAGLDMDKFFIGLNFYTDITDIPNPEEDLQMAAHIMEAKIFAGIRF
jgi:hypothetical protein